MCLLIHQGGGGQLVSQTPGSSSYPLPAVGQGGQTWLKMNENRLDCNTCAKYSCTHVACLVVGMQSWCDSLSRDGSEVDAASHPCCKGCSKTKVLKINSWLCMFYPLKRQATVVYLISLCWCSHCCWVGSVQDSHSGNWVWYLMWSTL